jgi:hypothetical protein
VGAGACAVTGLPGAALPQALVVALGIAGGAFVAVGNKCTSTGAWLNDASLRLSSTDGGNADAISNSATV